MFGAERLRHSTFDASSVSQQRPTETRYRNSFQRQHEREVVGLLVSGGLDSCILLKHLLDVGNGVKPFYIRSGLCWEEAELAVC